MFASLMEVKSYLVLICIFPTGEVAHPFHRFIWFLLQWNVFFCFSTVVFIFLLIRDFFIWVLDTNPLFVICITNISSQSAAGLFALEFSHRSLNFGWSQHTSLFLHDLRFFFVLRYPSLPHSRLERHPLAFSYKTLKVLLFTFKSLIHLELIFI